MGEHCFDPQIGLYDKDKSDTAGIEATPNLESLRNEKEKLPTASSLDRNLIDCEKKENIFDIFCGKARGDDTTSSSQFQVWIDTSSSMKKIDDVDSSGTCQRKSFIELMRNTCSKVHDVDFHVFNTRKKQLGGIDDVCLNVGLNDSKRLVEWIKTAQMKKLIIITDIYELDVTLSNYVLSQGGIIRGDINGSALTASNLPGLAMEVAKSCQKK